jgi:hypothetical protein
MQRVVRSSLIGLSLIGLAACGDKVNIEPRDTVIPLEQVLSVAVVPSTLQLVVGGPTASVVATVTATPGITNRAVNWSSSNTAVATVTAAGVVSAVAPGTAAIVATSQADTKVTGAAAVTVAAQQPVTVSISSFQQTICAGAVCNTVNATLSNVSGQLDVNLNVEAGQQILRSVTGILKIGTDSMVVTQTISNQAPVSIDAEASAAAIVTLTFNTAAFNATTGVPTLHNGVATFRAIAVTASGTQGATSNTTLTLNNTDVVASAAITTTPSTGQVATATDNAGLVWRGGAVSVQVVTVMYTTGRSIASATVTLNNVDPTLPTTTNFAILRNALIGQGITTSSTTITTIPGAATFANSTTAPGVGNSTIPFLGVTVTTVDAAGQPGPGFVTPVASAIRLDNRAPTAGAYVFNTQSTSNNWTGSLFVFNTAAGNGYTAAVTCALVIVPASVGNDCNGVDKVTTAFQWAPFGTTTWTTVTAASAIPASNTNTAYILRFIDTDAIGNTVTTNVAGTFGVDLTAPTLAITGAANLATSQVLGALSWTLTTTDDISGPGQIFVADVMLNGTTTTGALGCIKGTSATSTAPTAFGAILVFNPAGTAVGSCAPIGAVTGALLQAAGNATGNNGYFTLSAYATDQAGNRSTLIARQALEDAVAPVQGGISVPASFTGNTTASFATSSTDNLDIIRADATVNYGVDCTGAAPLGLGNICAGGVAMNIFQSTNAPSGIAFDNVLTTSSSYNVDVPNFITAMQSTSGANAPQASFLNTAPQPPTTDRPVSLVVNAVDAANNNTGPNTVNFSTTQTFSTATPYPTLANPGFATWTGNVNVATISNCPTAGCTGGAAPTLPTSRTLTGVATGPTGTFNVPFASVNFYYTITVPGTTWYLAGSATSPVATDNGVTRTWTYSLAFDPPPTTPQGASLTAPGTSIQVRVVGLDAAGNALASRLLAAPIIVSNP